MTKVTTFPNAIILDTFVRFSDLEDGDWFYFPPLGADGLGVKIDGRGFYPSDNRRGSGLSNQFVLKVSNVAVTAVY